MKKKDIIRKSIWGFALLLGLSGCDSLFDDVPVNKMTEESIWRDPQLIDSYTAGWYRRMDNGFKVSYQSISTAFKPWWGDQIYVGSHSTGTLENVLAENEQTMQSYGSDLWYQTYGKIQEINRLLDNAGKIPSGKQKELTLGEAHFFLAYHHFNLFRAFGGVILTHGSYNTQERPERIPRATYQEMIDYIVEEAQMAAEKLPVAHDAENKGRITKGAAMMLMAKTYMWAAAQPFQNQDKEYLGFKGDRSAEMQAKALEMYEAIDRLNIYQLQAVAGISEAEIADNYHNIFLTKHSSESILEVQHTNIESHFGHKLDLDAVPPCLGGTTTAFTPTQNHIDEYEMRDGKVLDPEHPYLNRDYRFYANILYDGSVYREKTLDMHYTGGQPGVDIRPYNAEEDGYTKTGYYMKKFLNPNQKLVDNNQDRSYQNYIIWRYAEVLLDEAELYFLAGNTAKALECVNKVRVRAHAAPLQSLRWEDIRHERRVELAFEESSYWDILRLGEGVSRLNGSSNPLRTVKIEKGTDGKMTYSYGHLFPDPSKARVFTARRYHLCIPWDEVDYQHCEQNPDWIRKE